MPAASTDVRARFGGALRDLRRRRRLTQEQLAERSGLSYKFIGEVERGLGNPTLTTMASLAEALGVALSALVGGSESPRVDTPDYVISRHELRAVREAVASIDTLVSSIANPTYRRKRRKR